MTICINKGQNVAFIEYKCVYLCKLFDMKDKPKRPQSYYDLMEMFCYLRGVATESNMYRTDVSTPKYKRSRTDITTFRRNEPIVIHNIFLHQQCTPAEWWLLGAIMEELKEYLALWYCDPVRKLNSGTKRAIRGLLEKKILLPTGSTNIYLVNPLHVRRGDEMSVIVTTAYWIKNSSKITLDHIKDRKPIKDFDFNDNPVEVLQLGYGYTDDTPNDP